VLFLAGIELGPLVSGVVGARRPRFDLWGVTVDVAQKLCLTSPPSQIQARF